MGQFADDIVSQAAAVESEIKATPSAVGFWGSIKVRFAGTTAVDVAVRLTQLRRSIAMQVAREQAIVGDGTPLVDPSREWACKMLADSVVSLDRGQSAEQLLDHLRYIQKRFGQNYPLRRPSKEPSRK
jgi:hypothetical protein